MQKVGLLLGVFQASLFDHMISAAKNRLNSEIYFGKAPEAIGEALIKEETENSKESSLQQASEHPEIEESVYLKPELRITKHGKLIKTVKSGKNDRLVLHPCRGIRKPPGVIEDIEGEYEETGQIKKALNNKSLKVLQRLGENKPTPARFLVPEESKVESTQSTLYGEVIATTYSQGGDGFALHPGDFVCVLQILQDFGLVECKWQGLKGLFPQDKVKLLARPSDSLNTSLSSIVSKQFTQSRQVTFDSFSMLKSSKLMGRLLKKTA